MIEVLERGRMFCKTAPVCKNLSLLMVTLALTGLFKTATAQQNVTESKDPIVHKELMMADANSAQYPGGVDQFYNYILTNVTPDASCVPGKMVYVYFVVDKEGKISKAKIRSKMLSDAMRKQIVAVFEKAPKWTPAQQNGSTIRESFVCPVMFMGANAKTALAKN